MIRAALFSSLVDIIRAPESQIYNSIQREEAQLNYVGVEELPRPGTRKKKLEGFEGVVLEIHDDRALLYSVFNT